MKKRILTLMMLCAGMYSANAQYQLANAGFEVWEETSERYGYRTVKSSEPVYWSSFATMISGGALYNSAAGVQLERDTDVREGALGKYSAYIYGAKVLGVATAQGNLTNGCVYGGSMEPADASGNYNFTNTAREDQSMKFSGRPDAVKVWIKASTAQNFNISFLLHENGYYQDPFANASKCAKLIAHAKQTPASNGGVWTEYTVPFVYDDATPGARPYYALVTFATSGTPGVASEKDKMWVDDVVMVYNSEIETATYDGNEVSFDGTSATVDALYDESKLALTSNGAGATIEKSYDETTAVLTITVKGDNISEDAANKHIYTIQFKMPVKEISISLSFTNKYEYTTLCLPFDASSPCGFDAYTVDGIKDNGATLVLTPIGTQLKAHQPVLLENFNYFYWEYYGQERTNSDVLTGFPTEGTPKAGLLTGTYEDIKAPKGSYVLQYQNETLGFYKVEDVQPTVKAYHAYLNVPDSNVKAFGFSMENGETAIKALEALTSGKPEIYDLNGRKLNKLQKGMNIVNGMKVLVK